MGLTGPNSGHQPGLLISPGVSRGVSIFVPFPARDHLLSLARGHFPIFKAINVGPTPHVAIFLSFAFFLLRTYGITMGPPG